MTEYLKSPLFQLKVGELVLSLLCAIIFFLNLPAGDVIFINIIHLTIFGYTLLNIMVIFSVVIQEPLSRSLFLVINGSGAVLFIVSGIIMAIEYFRDVVLFKIVVTGLISIVNGLVYAADTYYIIMYFQD